MPIWLIPILQLLPSLIQAIAGAVKAQPHVMTLEGEDLDKHQEIIVCLDKACEQLKQIKI